jgi:sulfite reductase beta subunit-like hemoprotein
LYVGGDFAGTRHNTLIADRVQLSAIADTLDHLIALFASDRADGEEFGDFCYRLGPAILQQALWARRRGAA